MQQTTKQKFTVEVEDKKGLYRKKNVTLMEARDITKQFSKNFDIPSCPVYFVDYIPDAIGLYVNYDPSHILINEKVNGRIFTLLHELIHHLDWYAYDSVILNHSSTGYIKAKKRVITWSKKNISNKINWNIALKARQNDKEMKKLRL